MSDPSPRAARRIGRSRVGRGPVGRAVITGLGVAYAGPALAYSVGRPKLGYRKGWIELVDDFAPWLYLPAPVVALAGLAMGSPTLASAGAALCGAFVERWGRRFLRASSAATSGTPTRSSDHPAGLSAEPAGLPTDLTLMTFNALAWTRDGHGIARAVERVDPDLLTLQEIGPRATSHLILALGRRLPYAAVHSSPTSSATATLSRFPILEAEPFTLSPEGAHWCHRLVVDAPGGPLTLLNIHTKIPRLRRSRLSIGPIAVPAAFHAERRLAEVRRLCELIDAIDGPLLAMGDFNMTERSEDHALIARRLTDAYLVAGRGLGHTFPAWLTVPEGLPLPFPALRLDHIWHSTHFRTVSARVGPNAGSDHHSLIVRLARMKPM